MQQIDSGEILTIPQVAKYLQLSKSKTYALVRQGKIPHLRLERNVRVRKSDLQNWIQQQIEEASRV